LTRKCFLQENISAPELQRAVGDRHAMARGNSQTVILEPPLLETVRSAEEDTVVERHFVAATCANVTVANSGSEDLILFRTDHRCADQGQSFAQPYEQFDLDHS
jgi:hypothetical protein